MRLLLPLLLLVTACATTPGGRSITGFDWRVSDINGVPVAPNTAVTVRFDGEAVSGSSGCNTFSGKYSFANKERIRFTGLSSTEKACAPEVMEQERRFLSILEAVRGYGSYSDGSLSLISPDGRAVRLRR